MTGEHVLTHKFVDFIPEDLEEGVVYVSIRFATASHLCCCGCKTKVVTPIRPTDWKLIFDGKTVSLPPSIGNWSFACQSHYWIVHNRVRWAGVWTKEEVAAGRARDAVAKDDYFHPAPSGQPTPPPPVPPSPPQSPPARHRTVGPWKRLLRWLGIGAD